MNEMRATTWNQLMDCLYEHAWAPTLQRFRPPFAFRGLPNSSFYVALHFVTVKTKYYDRDGIIWCLDYRKVHQQLPDSLGDTLKDEGADVFTIEMLSNIVSLHEFDALTAEPFTLFLTPLDRRPDRQSARPGQH